jgi:hypothetical protein
MSMSEVAQLRVRQEVKAETPRPYTLPGIRVPGIQVNGLGFRASIKTCIGQDSKSQIGDVAIVLNYLPAPHPLPTSQTTLL